jgi:hypothetical protein
VRISKNKIATVLLLGLNLFLFRVGLACDSVKTVTKKNVTTTETFDVGNNCKLKSRTISERKSELEHHIQITEWYENGKKRSEVKKKVTASRNGFPSTIRTEEVTIIWDVDGKETKTERTYSNSNF